MGGKGEGKGGREEGMDKWRIREERINVEGKK